MAMAESTDFAASVKVWQTGEGKLPRKEWATLVESRILDEEALRRHVAIWKFFRKRIVFTNGCFDVFHYGHWVLLARARGLGDVLVVAVNSDDSVRRLKGGGRPVFPVEFRVRLLASFVFVDAVVVFEEDTPERLIRLVRPDVLVKGSDYAESEIVGAEFVRSYGGEVVRIPVVEGWSTTAIIRRICEGGKDQKG